MIHLVTGGSGSGKSEYAESLILRFGSGQRFYAASMEAGDSQEGKQRIARHRRLRAGKGFVTLEQPRNLGQLRLPDGGRKHVLLECVTTLAANEMFGGPEAGGAEKGPADQERLCRKLLSDIKALAEQADNLVIVTGQLGEDGSLYDAGTMDYISLMGRLNQELAAWADRVTEVVFGIPVILKGEEE